MRHLELLLIAAAMLVSWFLWGENYARPSEPKENLSYFKYGLGVGPSAKPSAVSVKTLALGRQSHLLPYLIQQWEGGYWGDSSGEPGRRSSAYGGWSAGVNVDAGYLNLQSLWGAEGILTTDSMLGGNFQFHQDLFAGVKDARGCSWGANYAHMSSAGFEQPNRGRDFLTLRIGIPL